MTQHESTKTTKPVNFNLDIRLVEMLSQISKESRIKKTELYAQGIRNIITEYQETGTIKFTEMG